MHRRLTTQLHVFGALRSLATEDLSTGQLFDRLERLSGYRLYLATPAGRPLLPGVLAPPPELAGMLPASYDSPPAVPNGYVLPVPAPGRPVGFLLAIERPGTEPTGLAVVGHIATIAALQVSIRRHERETLRRQGAETLAELLQGVLDPATVRRRLARVGYDDVALTLAVLRPVPPPDAGWPRTRSHFRPSSPGCWGRSSTTTWRTGDIVPTVRTWLEHDRRTQQAAEALHLHPNTLAYRVRRFERLSGRSLASTADLAEAWLALQAVVHVAGSPS